MYIFLDENGLYLSTPSEAALVMDKNISWTKDINEAYPFKDDCIHASVSHEVMQLSTIQRQSFNVWMENLRRKVKLAIEVDVRQVVLIKDDYRMGK